MNRLTNHADIEDARRRLASLLEARAEWLCVEGRGSRSVEVRRGEWELRASSRGLLFSFWGDAGARAWRVTAWQVDGEKLTLEAARRMGAERATLELVPRASFAETKAMVADARRAECARLATLLRESLPGAKVTRASLSAGARRGEPGRYARIVLRRRQGETIAATGPVVPLSAEDADAFLASALLWHGRLEAKRDDARARQLLLFTPPKLSGAVGERVALLRDSLRGATLLYEIDEERRVLTPARAPSLCELLRRPVPRLARTALAPPG
jgi:hypothetical protein